MSEPVVYANFKSCGPGRKVLEGFKNHDGSIKGQLIEIEGCDGKGDTIELHDKDSLKVLKAGYYVISGRFFVQFDCPVKIGRFALLLRSGNNSSILAEFEAPSGKVIQFSYEQNFAKHDKIYFALLDLDRKERVIQISLEGQVTNSVDYDLLKSIQAVDNSRKVAYIPLRPDILTDPPFPPQYPAPGATYPWGANVIPSKVVPDPKPLTLPNKDGYQKFQSIRYTLGYYVGVDVRTIDPFDPLLTIFFVNLEDRGIKNYLKKVYISALLTKLMPFYNEKIDKFINECLSNFTAYRKPVLSSFREALVRFFLAIHIGYDVYPDFVIQYFDKFIDIIAIGDNDEDLLFGYNTVNKVREYFAKRAEIIKQEEDKTTLIYYWTRAGLNPQALVTEAIHNIIAFSQFNHVVFLLVRDKVKGTPNQLPANLVLPPPFDYVKGPAIKYDFFSKMTAAATEADKVNVAREMYRLLVPNAATFSKIVQANPDPNVTVLQGRHLHQPIMITNEPNRVLPSPPYPPNTVIPGPVSYYIYDPAKYAAFTSDFSTNTCPVPPPPPPTENYDPEDDVVVSPIDGETVIDKCNQKMIPIFNSPIYTPFGLGYRRCPGEALSYFITIKLIEKFAPLDFFFVEPVPPGTRQVGVAPFVVVPDNIFVNSP